MTALWLMKMLLDDIGYHVCLMCWYLGMFLHIFWTRIVNHFIRVNAEKPQNSAFLRLHVWTVNLKAAVIELIQGSLNLFCIDVEVLSFG